MFSSAIDSSDNDDDEDNDNDEDDNDTDEDEDELICVFGHRDCWPWCWTPPTPTKEETYFDQHKEDDDQHYDEEEEDQEDENDEEDEHGDDGEGDDYWYRIKIVIRIMMIPRLVILVIFISFVQLWDIVVFRRHIYVRPRSIPSFLWIPGCLYVRVCMAICVSASSANKQPQTVEGNLWRLLYSKRKNFRLIPSTPS